MNFFLFEHVERLPFQYMNIAGIKNAFYNIILLQQRSFLQKCCRYSNL